MEVIKKLAPGTPGTKRYVNEYGKDLVCVRYRHDYKRNRRVTTVELIVAERLVGVPVEPDNRFDDDED